MSSVHEGPPLSTLPHDLPLTLGAFVERIGVEYAEREALVFDDPLTATTVRWTYAELLDHSRRVAYGLAAQGITPGTPVGVHMGNRPEAVAALFGIGLAGGVAVLFSTFATETELTAMLERSGVTLVLTQHSLMGRELPAADRPTIAVGTPAWDALLAAPEVPLPDVSPDDPGLVLFSSGTSATPKGMVHLHRAPTLQFHLQSRVFRRTPEFRVWAPLPLFWTAGLTTALGSTLAVGATFVLQETFDAGEALALIERERVTEPYVLPHQGAALADHPDWLSADLSSLKQVFGKSVFPRHPSVEGDPTWTAPAGFGMSETCAAVISHTASNTRAEMKASTGRLLPGVRLRIVDTDTDTDLSMGEIGELALAGPMLLDHYVGTTRAETFDADGFLRTGDIGWIGADGQVHWEGRRTEMIKTAGANVAPAELEVELRACPDVWRAKVVGLPDDRLGEVVTLCAELVDGSTATGSDLITFLADRVATYKVPREVVVFDRDEIPTTATGTKIRNDDLIALAAARLGRVVPSPKT